MSLFGIAFKLEDTPLFMYYQRMFQIEIQTLMQEK